MTLDDIFSSCFKYRIWVLIRTILMRQYLIVGKLKGRVSERGQANNWFQSFRGFAKHRLTCFMLYSEISLLRPPKIKTSYLLKILFSKFKLFFSSFATFSLPLIRDHLWDCPKVVF